MLPSLPQTLDIMGLIFLLILSATKFLMRLVHPMEQMEHFK